MMCAYKLKARKNSGINDLFFWCDEKSEMRAKLRLQIAMEDARIEAGRGHDYQLPVRTDMPVFDDLPEEGVLDATWCNRYELADDNRTWQKMVPVGDTEADATTATSSAFDAVAQSGPAAPSNTTPVDNDLVVDASDDDNTEYPVAEMIFTRRLLSQFISDATSHHIKHTQRVRIIDLSIDTDNSYVQNLLLAANNAPELQSFSTAQLWKFTDAIRTVFPQDKRHELNHIIQFTKLWISVEHIDRGILIREWANGHRITSVQHTDTRERSHDVGSEQILPEEARADVLMEEIHADEIKAGTGEQTNTLNNESGHHIDEATRTLYTHFMVDLETMGSSPDAPVVSIGVVPFDPNTSQTGEEFYKVICLKSAMESGGAPDAGTILWWLKQSSEARAALLVEDALPLDDVLLQLNKFISENAASGPDSVQVWGNGATFDNVLLRQSYKRATIPCPWKFWNDRDVRTLVELGRVVGINPRYDIPFEGDMHNALADAKHQAKYVSAIWQRLIPSSTSEQI